jgi:hypothetical protein
VASLKERVKALEAKIDPGRDDWLSDWWTQTFEDLRILHAASLERAGIPPSSEQEKRELQARAKACIDAWLGCGKSG